ncbi:MAG: hypothetical protein JKY28_03245 [Sulfurimonas sp.]|nr:hypothetical protein [Sulfurimonas sp.]PHQ91406.1 MAG: hypothetical protein COB42_03585 [Sulfurimonas sp.]
MKKIKTIKIILLVSLLTATQSFAFGKSERNFLLGLGLGTFVTAAFNAHNTHISTRYYFKEEYRDSYRENRIYEKRLAREKRRYEKKLRRENRHHSKHQNEYYQDDHYYLSHDKHYGNHCRNNRRYYSRY